MASTSVIDHARANSLTNTLIGDQPQFTCCTYTPVIDFYLFCVLQIDWLAAGGHFPFVYIRARELPCVCLSSSGLKHSRELTRTRQWETHVTLRLARINFGFTSSPSPRKCVLTVCFPISLSLSAPLCYDDILLRRKTRRTKTNVRMLQLPLTGRSSIRNQWRWEVDLTL